APVVHTLAGMPYASTFADGSFNEVRFHTPIGLALDAAGTTLWVADSDNEAIRRLDLVHSTVTTPVGVNTVGMGVERPKPGALPATVHTPWGVVVTPRGLVITSYDESSVLLARELF